MCWRNLASFSWWLKYEKEIKISRFFFKWVPFVFQIWKQKHLSEENYLNHTKKTQFFMRQLHSPKQGQTKASSGHITLLLIKRTLKNPSLPTQLIIFLIFWAKVLRIAHPVNYSYLPPWHQMRIKGLCGNISAFSKVKKL